MESTPVIHAVSPKQPVPPKKSNNYNSLLISGGIVLIVLLIAGGLLLFKNLFTASNLSSEKSNKPKQLPNILSKPTQTPIQTYKGIPTSKPYISPTPEPTLIPSPTPTNNPLYPSQKTGSCGHGQCCLYTMCGDTLSTSDGGIGRYCTVHQKCMYSKETENWGCVNDCSCPYGCD
jgi:hypothetical protein